MVARGMDSVADSAVVLVEALSGPVEDLSTLQGVSLDTSLELPTAVR